MQWNRHGWSLVLHFTWFQAKITLKMPNSHKNNHILDVKSRCTNWAQLAKSNVKDDIWWEQKHRQNYHSRHGVTSRKQTLTCLEDFQVKTMFKQQVNSIVWTWFSLYEHRFRLIWQWLQTDMRIDKYARITIKEWFKIENCWIGVSAITNLSIAISLILFLNLGNKKTLTVGI